MSPPCPELNLHARWSPWSQQAGVPAVAAGGHCESPESQLSFVVQTCNTVSGLALLLNADFEVVFFVVSDALSKVDPSAAATAAATPASSAAANPKPVPAAAPAAPAPPAARTPPLPSSGDAYAAPGRGPEGDDDPSSRDPTAAQEHTHQPPLQRGGGDACSRCVSPFCCAVVGHGAEGCQGQVCEGDLAPVCLLCPHIVHMLVPRSAPLLEMGAPLLTAASAELRGQRGAAGTFVGLSPSAQGSVSAGCPPGPPCVPAATPSVDQLERHTARRKAILIDL